MVADMITGRMVGGPAQSNVVLSALMGGGVRFRQCGRGHGGQDAGAGDDQARLQQGLLRRCHRSVCRVDADYPAGHLSGPLRQPGQCVRGENVPGGLWPWASS